MTTGQTASEDQRRKMVVDAAYFRAERRGFNGGDPVADWLEAEAEVDAGLREMSGNDLLEDLDERLAVQMEGSARSRRSSRRANTRAESPGPKRTRSGTRFPSSSTA